MKQVRPGFCAMTEHQSSLVNLLERLRQGDGAAAEDLYNRFVMRVIGLVWENLSDPRLRQKVDAEDVVQSVFRSFFVNHQDKPADGDHLWHLLAEITAHKCINVAKHWKREKRDFRREEQVIGPVGEESGAHWLLPGNQPTPAEMAAVNDLIEEASRDFKPAERQVVILRLEGHTCQEISNRMNLAERTVRRWLKKFGQRLIRMRDETLAGSKDGT